VLPRDEPNESSRIDVDNEDDVRYWSERFGVSAGVLRHAVGEAGSNAGAVERKIRGLGGAVTLRH
jgi:hypothetical protein